MILITLNSISLAIYDYSDQHAVSNWNKTLNNIGLGFNVIFIIECVLKIVS